MCNFGNNVYVIFLIKSELGNRKDLFRIDYFSYIIDIN